MRDFVQHVHFVGIGGIGMSGIAEVLLDLGFTVSGSDLNAGQRTQELTAAGATIYIGHRAENIKGADVVVTSTAIDVSNPEVECAKANNIALIRRAEMLGELMRFRKGIAVSGTHGKTTTTSLIASVLVQAKMDPTFVVGGVVQSVRKNARLGTGQYLVAEADESDASFLHLLPNIAVITNIDRDHMETYEGSFERMQQTYVEFLHNLPFYGLAVMCFDHPVVREVAHTVRKRILSYGFAEDADFRAVNVQHDGHFSKFEVVKRGQTFGQFNLALPGKHNIQNALAAIAVADVLQVSVKDIQHALHQFQGIGRRFQRLGGLSIGDSANDVASVEIVDDYAHHPIELAATLEAAKQCWPHERVVTVFQPHRYTRTRDLFDDFVRLLAEVDNLIVMEVYAAGEKVIADHDGRALCQAIRKRGGDPLFVENFKELSELLVKYLQPGDKLLTMGAGNIGRYSASLAEAGSLESWLSQHEEADT